MHFHPPFQIAPELLARAIIPMLVGGHLVADDNIPQRLAAEDAMRRSNDYFMAHYPLGNSDWNRGAYHAGNLRAWETLGIQSYHDYAVSWAVANSWLVGPSAGTSGDADSQACGQTYLDLYQLDPQPVRIASIKTRLDALVADSNSEDDWWWVDALFMAAPAFARLGAATSDTAYFAQLEKMYLHTKNTRGLFSPALGLWYRDATAKARTGPNTPEFWGRGNGWALGACARVLETLPPGDPRRPEFQSMLQTMAASLLPLQGADGFWRANLMFPNHVPNPETSSTAFFTYGIAYGINEGLLDSATYTPVAMNAWNGLTTVALHPDGLLGYVQPIGSYPVAASYDDQQDYGYGAFLLAGAEILRLLGGPPPIFADAGPDLTTIDPDGDQVEAVTLDAGRTSIRNGESIDRYSWWLGTTFLGDGVQLTLEFPRGSHEVTLHVETSGGASATNSTTVSVNPPGIAVLASGNETGNIPENTLDGSFATRWSQYGDGEWIRYELPSVTTLDHVDLAFYLGNPRNYAFDLQISGNGQDWETVFSGQSSGTTLGLETFYFLSRSTRFLRYVGHGNSVNLWNNITEISIPLVAVPEDGDDNGLPDAWEIHHFGGTGQDPDADPNGDGVTLREDFILGGDPHAANPPILVIGRGEAGDLALTLHARAAFGPGYHGKTRKFRLLTSDLPESDDWQTVPGWESICGDNLPRIHAITGNKIRRFYKAASWLE